MDSSPAAAAPAAVASAAVAAAVVHVAPAPAAPAGGVSVAPVRHAASWEQRLASARKMYYAAHGSAVNATHFEAFAAIALLAPRSPGASLQLSEQLPLVFSKDGSSFLVRKHPSTADRSEESVVRREIRKCARRNARVAAHRDDLKFCCTDDHGTHMHETTHTHNHPPLPVHMPHLRHKRHRPL